MRAVEPIDSPTTGSIRLRRLLSHGLTTLLLGIGAGPALAQVTVNQILFPPNIGRTLDATVTIDYVRTSSAAAVITTVIPPQLSVNPPAPPAGCTITAVGPDPAVQCTVPAGVAADAGNLTFQVRGQTLGAFSLVATGTGGSSANNPGTVRSSGELTLTKTKSPAGNLLAGQSTTFTLKPQLAAGADDLPAGASIIITDQLPGTTTDFTVTAISGGVAACNSVANANSTRTVTCSIGGAMTAAALANVTIDITGRPGTNGNFTNVGSIAADQALYFDRNPNNNTANVNYSVDPASDVQASGSFIGTPVLTASTQTLTLGYANNGPMALPLGGTVSTTIPAGFTVNSLPAGCSGPATAVALATPTVLTCTAAAAATGTSQNFAIPLTMPAVATSGNFTVTVAPPAGYGDAVSANNTVNLPYQVATANADLRLAKSKSPASGPIAPGSTVTTTLTVTNDASSTSPATYSADGGGTELRVVDFLKPTEIAGDALSNVTAGWNCVVSSNADPLDATRTRRVVCTRAAGGSLAAGASLSVSFSTTVSSLAGQVTISNRACAGETALTLLGLTSAQGPQPFGNGHAGNDCDIAGTNLIATDVIGGQASITVRKESSNDNSTWVDNPATPAVILADNNNQYWRITLTTPAGGSQSTIPTLLLSDSLPGILNSVSPGAPAPSHQTPGITVSTNVTAGSATGTCPNLGAGSNALNCSFSNVAPGTTIVVTYSVQRPFASGILTNTATVSSPDSILGGTTSDSAAVSVAPRTDVAATSKTVTPATPRVGQTIQFTVTAQNLGPDSVATAGDFKIIDDLNTNVASGSVAFADIAASGANMNCGVANSALAGEPALPAGSLRVRCTNTTPVSLYSTRTITITARVLKPGALPAGGNVYTSQTNTARVDIPDSTCEWKTETSSNGNVSTACNDAASTSNNSRSVTFDVQVPLIDLQQRKTRVLPAGQTSFGVGQPLRYRFRIQNNGPSRAEGVVMNDLMTVPAGFTLASPQVFNVNGVAAEAGYALDASKSASVSCSQAGANANLVCVLSGTPASNFLDAGGEVNFEVELAQTGNSVIPVSFRNEALVCGDETVAYESSGACDRAAPNNNNIASVNDTIFPRTDLSIAKTTVTASPVAINQPVEFRLVVRNLGPNATQQIRVQDLLPPNLELITSGPNAPSVAVGSFVTQAPSTASGASLTCTPSPATITVAGQAQTVDCVLNATPGPLGSGAFPGSANAANTLTLRLFARAKEGYFTGPYLNDRTNAATVSVGQDGSGNPLSIDTVPGNNGSSSTVQVSRASLAGRVFNDRDGNGVQDGTLPTQDEGIGAVTITLSGTDSFGNAVSRSTTTQGAVGATRGDFLFDNLPPGNYTVTESQPAGYVNSAGTPAAPTAGGTYAAAATPTTSAYVGVNLAAGQVATGYLFPESRPPATISGIVFVDRNRNGAIDGAEPGIVGVSLGLYPAGTTCPAGGALPAGALQVVQTSAGGAYSFANVATGNDYVVCQQQPAGYGDRTPVPGVGNSTPRSNQINIPSLAPSGSTDNNFPEVLGGIAGTVFADFTLATPANNNNGVQNAGEPGIGSATAGAGVPVTLNGTPSAGPGAGSAMAPVTVTTAADGSYSFVDLFPGTYTVTEAAIPVSLGHYGDGINTAGAVSGGGTPGTAGAVGDNAIRNIVLSTPGALGTGNNFAELPVSTISGLVYLDADRDGALTGVDTVRLGGVVVELRQGGTHCGNGTLLGFTTTLANGSYSFPGGSVLPAQVGAGQSFRVCERQPAGYADGSTNPGTNAASPAANEIVITALPVGGSTGNNFGEFAGSISGHVFLDTDNDGNRAGDPPLPGVTITLSGTDAAGNPVDRTTITDASGAWRFDNVLAAGSSGYTVREQLEQPMYGGLVTFNGQTLPGSAGGRATGISTAPSAITGILLPAGANATEYNFAEILVTQISGTVYIDRNLNGTLDDADGRLGGVQIELHAGSSCGGALLQTRTTDSSGNYSFGAVPTRTTYTVCELQPPGYGDMATNPGPNGSSTVPNAIVVANLPPAGANGNNFGESASVLAGHVFLDRNDDGLRTGEPGLPGVKVTLTGVDPAGRPVDRSTVTDATGAWVFGDLPASGPGGYTVTEQAEQPLYNGSHTANGKTTAGSHGGNATSVSTTPSAIAGIVLPWGVTATEYNFGELERASISGTVFLDRNRNNVMDDVGTDGRIQGVQISLFAGTTCSGTPLARVQTDGQGQYSFGALEAGKAYTVCETQPVAWGQGVDLPGAGGAVRVPNSITFGSLPGGGSNNNNFGERPASLSGYVYLDGNDDGSRVGDAGIAGVVVRLTGVDVSGTSIDRSTTTDVDGAWRFDGLATSGPAGYTVTEQAEQPVVNGRATMNGQTTAGSMGGSATTKAVIPSAIAAIALPAGTEATEYNFGETLPLLTQITGTVYIDRNRDSQLDSADGRIAGATLSLYAGSGCLGTPLATALTDANGRYAFSNVTAGQPYTVCEQQPAGYANGATNPGVGGSRAQSDVILIASLPVGGSADNNFGEWAGSLAGNVYLDANNDDQRQGEVGIAGVTVTLSGTDINGKAVNRSTTTDATGAWRFDDLLAAGTGGYTVTEQTPQPVVDGRSTFNGRTTAGSLGGNATPVATLPSAIAGIPLAAGDRGTEYNFGERLPSSLSGQVFLDRDDNGQRGNGEPGLPGVTVVLTGTDDSGASVQRTAATDADGRWRFDDLRPGTYTVTEPNQPADTANGRTVAGSTGGTATAVGTTPSAIAAITLPAGVDSVDNNFGERPANGAISGRVWLDDNNNGRPDSGERGIPGVTVVLTGTDANGQPVNRTQQTDADGRYRFGDLPPGTYTVTEPVQPASTANGATLPGTIDGSVIGTATPVATTPSAIGAIVLPPGRESIDNNFGEVTNAPDLVVGKSANDARFTVGHATGYTLRVRNVGQAASSGSIALSDRLPPGITLSATPSGSGWTCTGAAGASAFSCSTDAVIAAGAEAAAIGVKVNVASAAQAASPVSNVVMVEGGGEPDARRPTPAERDAFNGNPTALPLCTQPATHNACRVDNPVQLASALSGTVWFDTGTAPGRFDGGDQRLGGWKVEVIDPATGQVIASTTTQPDGSYRITDLVPGVPYAVRFRDPETNVVYGFPVNGETAPGSSGVPCDAKAVPSSCVDRATNPQLVVVLAPGKELPQQSLPVDPSGVVYDAETRKPIPGAVVTMAPVGSCPAWSPSQQVAGATLGGYVVNGNSISMTTGSNGIYQLLLLPSAPASCVFGLTVTPPAGHAFPSAQIPPAAGPLHPTGAVGTSTPVQPQAAAPTAPVGPGTLYYLAIDIGSGTPGVVHNHIPLDPALPAGLLLRKTGDRQQVEVGNTVRYAITVALTSGTAPRHVTVVDRLPAGFSYVRGSASVGGRPIADPAGGLGPVLAFELGAMPRTGGLTLEYRARADVGSLQGDGINRATGVACASGPSCVAPGTWLPLPRSTPSNEARYQVKVTGGVFTTDACLAGKVFVDCNGNHVQDPEELGIPGVRLVIQDGTTLVSDVEGKYSACGLPPKSAVLRIDPLTLPRGARLTTSSNRNLGDAGSLWLDLKNGELHRADFIEGSCSNTVLEQVKARRAQGEVSAPEAERRGQPALRFDSKAHGLDTQGSPQQGTESANQQAPKLRAADSPAGSAAPTQDEQNRPTPSLPMNQPPPTGRSPADAPDTAVKEPRHGTR
jgi:uncharacterized repeat protein (TIGR01451 family)